MELSTIELAGGNIRLKKRIVSQADDSIDANAKKHSKRSYILEQIMQIARTTQLYIICLAHDNGSHY